MTRRRIIAAVLAGVLLLAGGAAQLGYWRFVAPGRLPQARNVVVPHGPPATVAEALLRAGVIDSVPAFRLAALLTRGNGPLHAAEFAFPASASLRETLTVLRTGRPVQHRLSIPEGLTAAQIAVLLDRTDALAGNVPVPAEGTVLPQSYDFEYGATRSAMMARASAAMRHALVKAWDERAPDLILASPEQMLILASIVERETAQPGERAHIAAVFLNRLRQGMKLQSDPTVAYAASGGLVTADPALTRANLEMSNPYNTYRVTGLPPGPIDSPGLASLLAVARPAASDDLYFVADGNGGHAFARTLEEHNRNVARWRKLGQQAGR